jgi:hypothetical protein
VFSSKWPTQEEAIAWAEEIINQHFAGPGYAIGQGRYGPAVVFKTRFAYDREGD